MIYELEFSRWNLSVLLRGRPSVFHRPFDIDLPSHYLSAIPTYRWKSIGQGNR